MTAMLALTDAVAAALLPVVSGVRGTVLRGRRTSLQQTERAGVRVNALRHTAQQLDLAGDNLQWDTDIVAALMVRAVTADDAESALDPYLATTFAALCAITWPTGVKSYVLEPVINIDLDEADQTVAIASFSLRVTHLTQGAALVAAA
jgi:hypothetical protein